MTSHADLHNWKNPHTSHTCLEVEAQPYTVTPTQAFPTHIPDKSSVLSCCFSPFHPHAEPYSDSVCTRDYATAPQVSVYGDPWFTFTIHIPDKHSVLSCQLPPFHPRLMRDSSAALHLLTHISCGALIRSRIVGCLGNSVPSHPQGKSVLKRSCAPEQAHLLIWLQLPCCLNLSVGCHRVNPVSSIREP